MMFLTFAIFLTNISDVSNALTLQIINKKKLDYQFSPPFPFICLILHLFQKIIQTPYIAAENLAFSFSLVGIVQHINIKTRLNNLSLE